MPRPFLVFSIATERRDSRNQPLQANAPIAIAMMRIFYTLDAWGGHVDTLRRTLRQTRIRRYSVQMVFIAIMDIARVIRQKNFARSLTYLAVDAVMQLNATKELIAGLFIAIKLIMPILPMKMCRGSVLIASAAPIAIVQKERTNCAPEYITNTMRKAVYLTWSARTSAACLV